MDPALIKDLTETEVKILEGRFEAIRIDWPRYFNFTYWKQNFTEEGVP